jgi:hypothetical protein
VRVTATATIDSTRVSNLLDSPPNSLPHSLFSGHDMDRGEETAVGRS